MAKVENGRVVFTPEELKNLRQLRADMLHRQFLAFASGTDPVSMNA